MADIVLSKGSTFFLENRLFGWVRDPVTKVKKIAELYTGASRYHPN